MEHWATRRDTSLDQVVDFPTISAEAWLEPRHLLTWNEATRALGVTRSQLRHALDRARRTAGADPLAVEGSCDGRRFRAVRPVARRGVAWRFSIPGTAVAPEGRIRDLRQSVREEAVPVGRPSPVRAMRAWLRRTLGRLAHPA